MFKFKKLESKIALFLFFILLFSFISVGCNDIEKDKDLEDDKEDVGVEDESGKKEKLKMKKGTYTSTVDGHQGAMEIEVVLSEDRIEAIEVVKDIESDGIGKIAIDRLPVEIINEQSTGIDALSGATITSLAIFKGVEDCIREAGGDINLLRQYEKDVAGEKVELDTDVLVIGGGGAGMTAAIEAKEAGAEVIILEREGFLGGDTGRAGGGVEAAGTKFQKENGIEDNPEDFEDFIKSRGISYKDPSLLSTMVNESSDAVDFLSDKGADMRMQVAGHGSPVPRAHRAGEDGEIQQAGQNIIVPLEEEIKKLDIDVYYNTPAYELIYENGKVTGAKAKDRSNNQEYEIKSKSTIIATGNFASNNEMVARYNKRLKGMGTNSSAGSLGEGIKMAVDVGADIENMDIMRVTTKLSTSVPNYIAIDQDGNRFMNEYNSHDTIFVEGNDSHIKATEKYPEKYYWVIIDKDTLEDNYDYYSPFLKADNFINSDSIEEISEFTKISTDKLEKTIEDWNNMIEKGEDPIYNRPTESMEKPLNGELYAIKTRPAVHNTAGGIRINNKSQVLDKDEKTIEGLYAGGEVTGGIHDGVSAVCCAIVFGRKSGIEAANYALKN